MRQISPNTTQSKVGIPTTPKTVDLHIGSKVINQPKYIADSSLTLRAKEAIPSLAESLLDTDLTPVDGVLPKGHIGKQTLEDSNNAHTKESASGTSHLKSTTERDPSLIQETESQGSFPLRIRRINSQANEWLLYL